MSILSASAAQLNCECRERTRPLAEARGWLDRACRQTLLARLRGLRGAVIEFHDAAGRERLGTPEPGSSPLTATLHVHDGRFFRKTAFGGSLGFGEAYREGLFSTSHLPTLLTGLARNVAMTEDLERGAVRWRMPMRRLVNSLRANTRRGSRRNIHAHYDLGNDFYRLWLDETMTYSSGVWPHATATLREASIHKYDRLCQKLDLQAGDHLVEIGTGWGGMAMHAAAQYGCRVTTTTISPSQAKLARERIASAGLADRVTVLESDYRDLTGQYDKLVSIEMIEAVGHRYLPNYFAKCASLLQPGGMAAIQAITIPDQRYESYRGTVDFIQRYIFPGGALPSLGTITRVVGQHTDLLLAHVEDFASHYARTLATWRERFLTCVPQVRGQGFDDTFVRTWEYYLAYCEAGFRERLIGVAQLVFAKSSNRHEVLLPLPAGGSRFAR